ncbi:MAG: S-methyl-5-thioribose-1-phosphate isomerase [Phycisphaerae bacterium]
MNRAEADESILRPIWWDDQIPPNGALKLLDQTRLPGEAVVVTCATVESVWQAIRDLQVRGAPAIGIAAAYGIIVGLDETSPSDENWLERLNLLADYLATSRPTAVNLFWALDRMSRYARRLGLRDRLEARGLLLEEAHRIRDEDAAMCRAIGEAGRELVTSGGGILTHCNAGALATSEYGTALAVLYAAHGRGRRFKVFVDETRPLLQGARLTTWELSGAGIDATLICDNMAAVLMRDRKIDLVITGADRIAANGDTANKIGTYGVAVLAAAHEVPFYVAAPSSTFDPTLAEGSAIPIEFRDPEEIRTVLGKRIAPDGFPCFCPAFDVTPAKLITGIITEHGIISPVTIQTIATMLARTQAQEPRG